MSIVAVVGIVLIVAFLALIAYLVLHIRTGRRQHRARIARLHIHGMTARIRKHHDNKSSE